MISHLSSYLRNGEQICSNRFLSATRFRSLLPFVSRSWVSKGNWVVARLKIVLRSSSDDYLQVWRSVISIPHALVCELSIFPYKSRSFPVIFNPYAAIMWYLIFVNALFIPIGLVSSRLVPHNLYPRQAVNPYPLQYCRTQVGLGGCPYPCVDGKCPCYEFCTDGEQVCKFQQDGSVVFQYCVVV